MKHGCVLIADMHHGLLESICKMLEAMFETVIMVASKDSLFESTRKLNPDLVVIDVSFSSDGKSSIVKEFISIFPGCKILVMSSHDDGFIAKDLIQSGANGFILKRTLATELYPAINSIFKRKTYVSPSISDTSGLSKNYTFTGNGKFEEQKR
jgi:DNA-binding NarL/FixJ family response regulator